MNNEPVAWLLFFDGEESFPQYTKSYKQMREWETYIGDNQRIEPHYTHPVKELTDEDIAKVVHELNQKANTPERWVTAMQIGAETIIQLRDELAILRKAQE